MSSRAVVLDASAVLCLMLSETGADRVEALMQDAVLSAVNYAEVLAKLIDHGLMADEVVADISDLGIRIVDVDRRLAETAARLRGPTRHAGLSLGDRTCLALAMALNAEAVTTDRIWGTVAPGLGIAITVVR